MRENVTASKYQHKKSYDSYRKTATSQNIRTFRREYLKPPCRFLPSMNVLARQGVTLIRRWESTTRYSGWRDDVPSLSELLFYAKFSHLIYWMSLSNNKHISVARMRELSASDPESNREALAVPRRVAGIIHPPGPRNHFEVHDLMMYFDSHLPFPFKDNNYIFLCIVPWQMAFPTMRRMSTGTQL
jgi:hypothetical protein